MLKENLAGNIIQTLWSCRTTFGCSDPFFSCRTFLLQVIHGRRFFADSKDAVNAAIVAAAARAANVARAAAAVAVAA